jgi:hypothetical protein
MKIVFMGTPDYAAITLEALLKTEHEIAAVFAQPDKPVGRKHILTPPPVKVVACEHNIPVYQPNSLKTGDSAEILKEIAPDVLVVVAYGKILPKEILNIPKTKKNDQEKDNEFPSSLCLFLFSCLFQNHHLNLKFILGQKSINIIFLIPCCLSGSLSSLSRCFPTID